MSYALLGAGQDKGDGDVCPAPFAFTDPDSSLPSAELPRTYIVSGKAYRHQLNELSGQDELINYDVDVNFDGAFDEKDNEVSYPFNFAVVAAAPSYSAANYLANMAKDNGVCLLGETTSGGSNAPQVTPEAEGFSFRLSARYKLMDKNNENVDFGIEPDYVLTQEKDGAKDYTQYFDLATIGKYVSEYYAK